MADPHLPDVLDQRQDVEIDWMVYEIIDVVAEPESVSIEPYLQSVHRGKIDL